jgi:hypothetical protein
VDDWDEPVRRVDATAIDSTTLSLPSPNTPPKGSGAGGWGSFARMNRVHTRRAHRGPVTAIRLSGDDQTVFTVSQVRRRDDGLSSCVSLYVSN